MNVHSRPESALVRASGLLRRVHGALLVAVLASQGCDAGEEQVPGAEAGSSHAPQGPGPSSVEAGTSPVITDASGPASSGSRDAGGGAPSDVDAAIDAAGEEPSTVDASVPPSEAGPAQDDASVGVVDAATGDGSVPPWATRPDLGKGDGKDVITIGDSWMDYFLSGGGIEAALDRAGTRYRHYGVSATTLLSGQIPGQYDRAKRENPSISTVIMTGGGNDIMFDVGSCSTAAACAEKLAEISAALDKLWTRMAADGVKDVIYIAYSEDAGSTPKENRGQAKPVPICLKGPIICHTLPTTDLVMKDLLDGIHPTSAANTRIAKALLSMMEQRGIRR